MQLPGNFSLGNWLFDKDGIWQMRLLDEDEIERYANERGVRPVFFNQSARKLWQLGLLFADLVESPQPIELDGLILVGSDPYNIHYYADERLISPSSAVEDNSVIDSIPGVRLLFHPFRYYVLYQIDRILRDTLRPLEIWEEGARFPTVLQRNIDVVNVFPKEREYIEHVNRWNRISALAIALEPCQYSRLFGTMSRPAGRSMEEQDRLISTHLAEVKQCLQIAGQEILQAYWDDLCYSARILDPNEDVHTLLRLTEGEKRIKDIQGRLGGSMLLLTMAEMLRRGSELTFGVELREEDEAGSAPFIADLKKEMYGSKRIFDGRSSIRTRWLQAFGLNSGVRLRWYVEGDTEYHALQSAFGSYIAIDLVNLRGQVAARAGKGVGFRDNLRSDLKSLTFSFISIDGDRPDYLAALKKAAEEDEICGMFFVAKPDFEFQNFTLDELEEIIWQITQDQCPPLDFERTNLHAALQGMTNTKDLLEAVRKVGSCLQQFGKGPEWGKRLIDYAWQHPEKGSDGSNQQTRQVVDAIYHALRTAQLDYQPSRDRLKVDPMTGMPVRRNPGDS